MILKKGYLVENSFVYFTPPPPVPLYAYLSKQMSEMGQSPVNFEMLSLNALNDNGNFPYDKCFYLIVITSLFPFWIKV